MRVLRIEVQPIPALSFTACARFHLRCSLTLDVKVNAGYYGPRLSS